MGNLPALLQIIKKRSYHPEGLLCAILIYALIIHLMAGSYLTQNQTEIINIGGIAILIGGWFYTRRIPRFKGNEIGILFAPHSKEEVREDLDTLFNEVTSLLKQERLGNLFNFKKIPEHIIVNDNETAELIRVKSRCLLLIWGNYEKGNIGGQEVRGFCGSKSISFTYAVPNKDLVRWTNEDIDKCTKNRFWSFNSSNDLIERNFLKNNLVDVSRFIIGLCLFLFGELEKSKIIFSEIITKPYGTWKGNANNDIFNFLNTIKPKLAYIDNRKSQYLYIEKIFNSGKLYCERETLEEIIELTKASIKNEPSLSPYLLQAIMLFLQDEIVKSKNILNKARKRWPSDPNVDYSLAFLYAYTGDLRKSKTHYRRAFMLTPIKNADDLFHLVEFPEAYLEKDSSKYHLHFALGLLHYELVDPASGLKHFEKFIEISLSHNLEKDKPWVIEAEEYISKIKTSEIQVIESP